MLNVEVLTLSSEIRNEAKMPIITTFIQHGTGGPVQGNKALSLFANWHDCACKNPKLFRDKLLYIVN